MGRIITRSSIYKRERNGRTTHSVRFYDHYGVRREKSARTRKQAEALRDTIIMQINAGTYGVEEPENPRFKDFCKQFLKAKEREVKDSSIDDYRQVINNHLVPFFKKKRLTEITPSTIHSFLNYISEKKIPSRAKDGQARHLSPSTVGKAYRYLKVILRYSLTLQLIDRDPTIGIRPPRVQRKEMDYLTVEEIRKLLDTAEGDTKELLAVAIFSGLRQGEIFALRWGDIDFKAGVIKVVRSYHQPHGFSDLKTSASRRAVHMIPRLASQLKARHEAIQEVSPDNLVFTSSAGTPVDRHNFITYQFAPALKKAGIRRVGFHDLRHTYASLCIAAGMDPKALQKAMGHSSIIVTMDTYAHLFPGSYATALARIEDMLSEGTKVVEFPAKERESA